MLPTEAGTTSLRRLSIRSVVAASCGADVGYTSNSVTFVPSLPWIVVGGVTTATPGWVLIVFASCVNAAACAAFVGSATIWSGPLKPGPNPLASRS